MERDHAKRTLVKDFVENEDYTQKSFSPKLGKSRLGRPKVEIHLTVDCFKKFCLMARSKVGIPARAICCIIYYCLFLHLAVQHGVERHDDDEDLSAGP